MAPTYTPGLNEKNFLVDLHGKHREDLKVHFPEFTKIPLLYLPTTDQILFIWRYDDFTGQHADLWVYDFKTEKQKILFKHIGYIVVGTIYYPD